MSGVIDLFRLDGKKALVTGCSRGIGAAMAIALAEAGADIVGVSASLPDDGGETGQRVSSTGRKFHPYRCDFGDREAVRTFVSSVKSEHPVVDILVCNAGTIRRQPAAEYEHALWDEVIDVNLRAPFVLSREFGGKMIARGSGKVIFTASLLSFQGGITVPGYAASKGGIARLTMALSNEWASRGVCVNAIAPGYIATDNTEALRNDPARAASILSRIPSGRWGNPGDMSGAVVFLASPASDYVTGTILTVDGGWMGR
jgi:2-deoxy-D-gluconate 3-dehydrogenase